MAKSYIKCTEFIGKGHIKSRDITTVGEICETREMSQALMALSCTERFNAVYLPDLEG